MLSAPAARMRGSVRIKKYHCGSQSGGRRIVWDAALAIVTIIAIKASHFITIRSKLRKLPVDKNKRWLWLAAVSVQTN